MLTEATLERWLARIPTLTVGVLGDLFLDRYLELDAARTEPSLETGLDAYQVVRVRASPGAAGTVLNNLAALGVGRILPVAVIGDDGEGYELRQALAAMPAVDAAGILAWEGRRTPTYTKPMLHAAGQAPRELNRLDIKNRTPLPTAAEDAVLGHLHAMLNQADAVIVLDQVSEVDCGVVTARVREELARHAAANPTQFLLADSRERIGLFRGLCLKPNRAECLQATGHAEVTAAARELARRAGAIVFCTQAEAGICVAYPDADAAPVLVPAFSVSGPLDPVGAGDSTSAALACASAAGACPEAAAAFGNLIASITIQQLGTTGTASPQQVRARWQQVQRGGTA